MPRVATAASAHHDSTGICAASTRSMISRKAARFALDAGEGLDHRQIAQDVRRLLGQMARYHLDIGLQALGPAQHECGQQTEARSPASPALMRAAS